MCEILISNKNVSPGKYSRKFNNRSLFLISFLFVIITIEGRLGVESRPHQSNANDSGNIDEQISYFDNLTSIRDQTIKLSTTFPSLSDTRELLRLSSIIYTLKQQIQTDDKNTNNNNMCLNPKTRSILGPNIECHLYERDRQDTQMMIVSNAHHKYIAVVFAGTDDLRNTLTDSDVATRPFGPQFPNGTSVFIPDKRQNEEVRVHAGFNNAVFRDGLFDRILNVVNNMLLLRSDRDYRVFTTGHSLGAADSVLAAVALKHYLGGHVVNNINFGCPKTGNRHWMDYVNSIPDLGIWRFVYGPDVIARLPDFRFVHVGHTVQMDGNGARAYYLHYGDSDLHFRGVPFGWNAKAFMEVPFNVLAHFIQRYTEYIEHKSHSNPKKYYVHEFERSKFVSAPQEHEPTNESVPTTSYLR